MFKAIRAAMCLAVLTTMSAGVVRAQEFAEEVTAQRWQCAPFARLASGIQIFGNAGTWWDQADGRYERGDTPEPGAVLVFKASGRMRVGHVATVTEVVDARTIKVTHANWSPINGSRGQIEQDVAVVDVSENNDWSEVRVWYAPLADIGTSANPTYGFIYQDEQAKQIALLDKAGGMNGPQIQLASVEMDDAVTYGASGDAIGALIGATAGALD